MKRHAAILIALGVTTTVALAVVNARKDEAAPAVTAEPVTRGSVVSTISTSGTVEAVSAVEVGTQVSGVIESLFADYNSLVRRGQLLARLDQSLFRSAIQQAQANVERADAELQRALMTAADGEKKLARAQELAARELIPRNQLDDALLARDTAAVQIRSAEAGLAQARASLRQAQVNLEKTVIASPIDGIVISRNVDVGQTVAASMSAPTLFVLAGDLSRMQVHASVDESDIGGIRSGQPVTFTVDAYPGDQFPGTVEQVRLTPITTNNVVTYTTIVRANNPALKLRPGMTANLTIEVGRKDDVLRAPAAAARFKPTAEVLEALHATAAAKGSTVWTYIDGHAAAVPVKFGASDGTWTEVVDAPFTEGTPLITRVVIGGGEPAASRATAPATSNPLMGTQQRRGR